MQPIWSFTGNHVIHYPMTEKTKPTNRLNLNKTVALVGMMGAGKTAVGKALAALLDVPFLDSDASIEEAANMSVQEIFARDGEAFFREKESQVIARLLISHRGILSTGGGAFLLERNRKEIARKGVSVWLDADLDLLWSRVRHKDTRPLLRTADPRGTLAAIYADRVPIYRLADIRVAAERSLSVEQMADRVLRSLIAHPGIVTREDSRDRV